MNHPFQINDFDRKDQGIASPSVLLPTKVNEFRQLDGSVAYEAFPRGHGSRWTAQPVLQWLESLAAAAEAIDGRGAITVGGMCISDPTPAAVLRVPRPNLSFLPQLSDDDDDDDASAAVGKWDLSYIDYHDPMAWMYTRQVKILAGRFEETASMTGSPKEHVPTAETENMAAAYSMVQTRMKFTFDRIMGQYRQNYHPDLSLRADTTLVPPAISTETGEVRALLDTLYEETIQKLKTMIGNQQAYQQRGSMGTVQPNNAYYRPAQPPVKQYNQHQSKQELAKFMTAWLRANFTNPYPDDEGLVDMAAQCGTTNQVISNWLINARTRKWRPAIIKASEMKRPADLLLEDTLNIFDNKPVREINPMDYTKPQQSQAPYFEEPTLYDEYDSISHEEEMEHEEPPQPVKRFRSNY